MKNLFFVFVALLAFGTLFTSCEKEADPDILDMVDWDGDGCITRITMKTDDTHFEFKTHLGTHIVWTAFMYNPEGDNKYYINCDCGNGNVVYDGPEMTGINSDKTSKSHQKANGNPKMFTIVH